MKAAPGTRKAKILALLKEHPEMTAKELAYHACTGEATVRSVCYRAGVVPGPSPRTLAAGARPSGPQRKVGVSLVRAPWEEDESDE